MTSAWVRVCARGSVYLWLGSWDQGVSTKHKKSVCRTTKRLYKHLTSNLTTLFKCPFVPSWCKKKINNCGTIEKGIPVVFHLEKTHKELCSNTRSQTYTTFSPMRRRTKTLSTIPTHLLPRVLPVEFSPPLTVSYQRPHSGNPGCSHRFLCFCRDKLNVLIVIS